MTFKIYNSDFGIKIGGVNYDFPDVAELTIEDPETNKLTRGANGANRIGLVYKEDIREPKRWTIPILQMSAPLKERLDLAFENQERCEPYCVDRLDGSSKMLKSAILCKRPQQLTISEDADSMNVALEFESFDSSEKHKS